MIFGYVRTWGDERPEAQRDALIAAGARILVEDHSVVAGAVIKPNFDGLLVVGKPGDEVVMTGFDRLGKRIEDVFAELLRLESKGLGVRMLDTGIASEAGGPFFDHVRAFCDLMASRHGQDRTRNDRFDGTVVTRRSKPGQKPVISDARWAELRAMLDPPQSVSMAEVARLAGVSRQAIYKRMRLDKRKDS